MTSVSSLGSTLTQYQSPLSSLDKNGDGVISADELAAEGERAGHGHRGRALAPIRVHDSIESALSVIGGRPLVVATSARRAGAEPWGLLRNVVERAEEHNGGPLLDDAAALLLVER